VSKSIGCPGHTLLPSSDRQPDRHMNSRVPHYVGGLVPHRDTHKVHTAQCGASPHAPPPWLDAAADNDKTAKAASGIQHTYPQPWCTCPSTQPVARGSSPPLLSPASWQPSHPPFHQPAHTALLSAHHPVFICPSILECREKLLGCLILLLLWLRILHPPHPFAKSFHEAPPQRFRDHR